MRFEILVIINMPVDILQECLNNQIIDNNGSIKQQGKLQYYINQ